MSRFRLRFLLQEFDLPVGEVVIGRSPDCHITIEDPLISRRHAKIIVTPTEAIWHDLGSRNGSRINGSIITGPTTLQDADRIRLGAQELVFFQVGQERRAARQTGAMLFCRKCAIPFPEGARVCPHCGAVPGAAQDDETMSGLIVEPRRTWMLQLMGEVLERALAARKLTEAERILQRAADEFNDRVNAGEAPDARQLMQIADYAARLAVLQTDGKWIKWVTEMFKRLDRLPTPALIERLADARELPGVRGMLTALVDHWREHESTLASDELASLERIAVLARPGGV